MHKRIIIIHMQNLKGKLVLEKLAHYFLSVIQRLIIFLSAIQRLIIFLSAIQRLIIFPEYEVSAHYFS